MVAPRQHIAALSRRQAGLLLLATEQDFPASPESILQVLIAVHLRHSLQTNAEARNAWPSCPGSREKGFMVVRTPSLSCSELLPWSPIRFVFLAFLRRVAASLSPQMCPSLTFQNVKSYLGVIDHASTTGSLRTGHKLLPDTLPVPLLDKQSDSLVQTSLPSAQILLLLSSSPSICGMSQSISLLRRQPCEVVFQVERSCPYCVTQTDPCAFAGSHADVFCR